MSLCSMSVCLLLGKNEGLGLFFFANTYFRAREMSHDLYQSVDRANFTVVSVVVTVSY